MSETQRLELNKHEAKVLGHCVRSFAEAFTREVAQVVAQQFRGAQPPAIGDMLEQLTLLGRQLEVDTHSIHVHEAHARLLRRVLIDERRRRAQELDAPLRKATDAELSRHLQKELHLLEQLMTATWFQEVEAQRVPRLTDFMSIRHAEEAHTKNAQLSPREYDEKFHILEAPRLFVPDLAYYRDRCGLRDAPLTVAFADIDDFKRYNTELGETRVDRDLLVPFMETVEGHFFARGHAYRFGGDEYVLLMPNCDIRWGEHILRGLQERLARMRYRGVKPNPTISVGLCGVDADTILTDREVQDAACRAKGYAKRTLKGSMATFDGILFRDADLRLMTP